MTVIPASARHDDAPSDSAPAKVTPLGRLGSCARLLPGLAVAAVVVAVWLEFEIPVAQIASFTAYVLLGVVLPGTLVWRALGPRLRFRIEEYAAGAGVGYAIEALARIAGSMLGVPALGLAIPVLIVVVFAAVPGLRGRFRSAADPLPVSMGAVYAVICSLILVWLAYGYFGGQPDVFAGLGMPDSDQTFTLAFTSDVANRWPPENGFLLGEKLYYHWFWAAHVASAHTATGIELSTLSLRLVLVPMLLVLIVGTGALGVRLAKRAWAGPLAAFLGLVVNEPMVTEFVPAIENPRGSAFGNLLGPILYMSPTLTYSMVIVVPIAILVVDVLRRQAVRGHWILLVPLLVAVSGAKGTVLPMIIAGAGTVAAVALLVERRVHVPAAALLGVSIVVYFAAYFLVYGGESYGTKPDMFGVAAQSALASTFTGHWPSQPGAVRSVAITTLMMICFLAPWAGSLLLIGQRTRRDPAAWMLAGMAVLAVGTAVSLYHSGQSQLYFYRNALPVLAAGAAWAITVTVPATRRAAVVLVGALTAGALAGIAAPLLYGNKLSIAGIPGFTILRMLKPFLFLVLLFAVAAALYVLARRLLPGRMPAVSVLVVVVCLAAGAGAVRLAGSGIYATGRVLSGVPLNPRPGIKPGAELAGARWLRDHSGVRDVVVTNVHCANGEYAPPKGCNALSFWVAAYTERRVLVEGWGYTSHNARQGAALKFRMYPNTLPFWDLPLLNRNDRFIKAPTGGEAKALRAEFNARWVYADTTFGPVSPALASVLTLRYTNGPVQIYEIR